MIIKQQKQLILKHSLSAKTGPAYVVWLCNSSGETAVKTETYHDSNSKQSIKNGFQKALKMMLGWGGGQQWWTDQ